MTKKNVLIITPVIKSGGGPPGYVFNLKDGLNLLKNDSELNNIYQFIGEEIEGRNKALGEKIIRKNTSLLRRLKSAIGNLLMILGLKYYIIKILKKDIIFNNSKIRKCDIIIFQGFQNLQLIKYAKSIKKYLIYMPHSPSIMADEYRMISSINGDYSKKIYKNIFKVEKKLFEYCDLVVFPSPNSKLEYTKNYGDTLLMKKIIYIKSGVKVPLQSLYIRGNYYDKNRPINIYFVGRYVSHKGYDIFCEAAELLSKKFDHLNFYTVGGGPIKFSSSVVKDMGWRDDIFKVLENADLVVIPNKIAYYDLLPLECAALGKPLVMTCVGGNKDQLEDLKDSVSCDEVNAVCLAAAIEDGAKLFQDIPGWGINNRKAYEDKFTTKEFARRWDVMVDSI